MNVQAPIGPVIHSDLIQGSDEWLEARRGIITASEVKLILTPTLKVARTLSIHQQIEEMR